ncbi:MerR family transcriptional regulator [Anoxybacterium hadale]|uniref:MerR family transcriptional regulator n=1 Tax=Anoxybacterium hadale TaxID=3408580 RepID=A0ACD1ACL2_9FIRM|nr:MerR family transcriptional regulator [Clostridiales bacterium]
MRTIKHVSDLTGVSVRMLHYYDKIGLLRPSAITEAGYRLYSDESLEILQQILFFKELDVPLKNIHEILESSQYHKINTLHKQKELLLLKRDRLNELVALIDKKLKGGNEMSFKEFDMSEYFNVLETFKQEHESDIIKYYGSIEEFDIIIETMKSKELEGAKMAIQQFGSIGKYTEAIKNNLENLPTIMEGFETMKENIDVYSAQADRLMEQLTSDMSKSPSSSDIQGIVKEMNEMLKEHSQIVKMDMGENYWRMMADMYLTKPAFKKVYDKKYGKGAAKFVGEALKFYSENTI